MVLPLIPILAAAAIVLGVSTLAWYSKLSPAERERADLRANEIALELFGMALDTLDKVRFTRVILAVKREITGKPDEDPVEPLNRHASDNRARSRLGSAVRNTKKAVGQRGSWFAAVDGELLPCVHQHWFKSGRYDDPEGRPERPDFGELFNAIREKGRVILTCDDVEESEGELRFTRTGYVGVFSVDDTALDEKGLRFRFTARLADLT